jgi:hypothetical protein
MTRITSNRTGGGGEIQALSNERRLFLVTHRGCDPKGISVWALDEDVVACLQCLAASREERFIQRHDILPEDVCTRVDPVKMEQPSKEFDFAQEPIAPNLFSAMENGVMGMESKVGAPACEEWVVGQDQAPDVRRVIEVDMRHGIKQSILFGRGLAS